VADSPKIAAARTALAEYDAPRCGRSLSDDDHDAFRCTEPVGHAGGCALSLTGVNDQSLAEHLRAALAALDEVTAERDQARQDHWETEQQNNDFRNQICALQEVLSTARPVLAWGRDKADVWLLGLYDAILDYDAATGGREEGP
jgi:hypothetical protein